jgi:hypothetical protein
MYFANCQHFDKTHYYWLAPTAMSAHSQALRGWNE